MAANSLSDYGEKVALDAAITNSGRFVRLFTVAPAEDGTGGTEVSGGAYAAQALTCASATTSSGTSSKSNNADILFPTATAAWGTVVGQGVYDAATGGNLIWYTTATTAINVTTGVQYKLPAGSLTYSMD